MLTFFYSITGNKRAFLKSPYNTDGLPYASTLGNELYKKQKSYSLEELAVFNREKTACLIICSKYLSKILTVLLNKNFQIEKLFYYKHANSQLKSIPQLFTHFINENSVLYALYLYNIVYLTVYTVPLAFTGGNGRQIVLNKHVIIGANTITMLSMDMAEGTIVGDCTI
jgi:hypothetical protein